MISHSFRPTVRDEFAAVIAWELDALGRCEEQEAHYAQVRRRLVRRATAVERDHRAPPSRAAVVAAMETWYAHVLRYSRRDQLSVWYALRATGVEPLVHDLDNHESPFHVWPVSVGRDRRRAGIPWGVSHELEARRATEELAVRATEELALLTSSKSWRWTAPLRATRRRLGQLRPDTA